MDDQNAFQQPQQSGQSHVEPPVPQKKGIRKWTVVIIAVVIILLGSGLAYVMLGGSKDDNSKESAGKGDSAAATTLFDTLGKAASQPTIRVAMLRQTYATKADLASGTDPGFIQSSVGEVGPGKFRAVYAQRPYNKETFSMQRCIDGTTYIDGLSASNSRIPPKTLAEANEYLKQMYKVTENLQFIVCPHVGVMPGGTTDLAPVRLSDGVMPVTLTESQASNWKNKIKAAGLFDVKDEGMTMRGSKQLRKFSFTPSNNQTDINQRLYDIFYETAEIDKIKRDHPKAEWQYEFIAINPSNTGSIKGFYLVDEVTDLPVYSELEGVNPDRDKSNPSSKANLGFNKQTYAFPANLSLELTSPLEFLQ